MNRKEFKDMCLFVFIFFVFSLCLSGIYSKCVMASSILNRVDWQFRHGPSRIHYLIMGDSHSQYGLDPDVIKDSFNFSTAGGNYVHTYYKLKYIIDHGLKKIDILVLPLDMHSFSSSNFKEPQSSWYWLRYVDYLELGRHQKKSMYYFFEILRGRFFPFVGQRDPFLRFFLGEEEAREISSGFIPMEGMLPASEEELMSAAHKRAEYHFQKEELTDQTMVLYFGKTIRLCEENNIKVILVRFPVSKMYHDAVIQMIPPDYSSRIIGYVQSRYPGVYFMDFWDIYLGERSLFQDVDHLNSKGAVVFSKEFLERLQKVSRYEEEVGGNG